MSSFKNLIIADEYKSILGFKNETEALEHEENLISARILSEVEKRCLELGMKRKDLAKAIGTSASYITQLYNGDKLLNIPTIAKFQKALNITFTIAVKESVESFSDFDIQKIYAQKFRVSKKHKAKRIEYIIPDATDNKTFETAPLYSDINVA